MFVGCPNWQFACKNGDCINLMFVCDGQAHCQHGEDEENCFIRKGTDTYLSQPEVDRFQHYLSTHFQVCDEYSFKCEESLCLYKSSICDGKQDCIDTDDDERHCSQGKHLGEK